ncbi:MAG: PepSY-associated TM helix domain-containing protein [Muribaculaceae bacterium]
MQAKKIFRKIHLWLSVPFGIVLTLICFSGAMLVFEKEITEWCRHDVYFVNEVKGEPMTLDALMEKVAATLPDSVEITGVTVSADADRTLEVTLSKPRRSSIFVDPYTGEITGRNERLGFFSTMFSLHRWLLGSARSADGGMSAGKLIVGVSTIALVLILLTGLLMWLTNRKKPLTKSLKISVTQGWHRFWHDLHVAGGIYATIFLLAIALTGLTWSFSWYRAGFYSLFGVEASADRNPQHGNAGADRQSRSENRQHNRGEGRRHHDGEGERHHRHHSPFDHWNEVYSQLAEANPGFRQITIAPGKASVVPQGSNSLRAADSYEFDPRSGEITGHKPYSAQEKSVKARGGVYMVHVGSWGGIITRIINFVAAMMGAILAITGYYLWIRRLVKKSPKKHHN